jgi:hypothetical protein
LSWEDSARVFQFVSSAIAVAYRFFNVAAFFSSALCHFELALASQCNPTIYQLSID